MVYGALGMAMFSVLWTAVAFLLAGRPYQWGEGEIGLLGLVGVVGAAAAQGAGRLFDRGLGHPGTGAFLAILAAGWGLLEIGGWSLPALLAGVVLIDFGVQGNHILSQSTIYALRPDARSRVTTAYMAWNFLWGAVASAGAAWAWTAGGWDAVCALGGALAISAFAVWGQEHFRSRGRMRGRARASKA
jgi:hypothetical protein